MKIEWPDFLRYWEATEFRSPRRPERPRHNTTPHLQYDVLGELWNYIKGRLRALFGNLRRRRKPRPADEWPMELFKLGEDE